MRLVLVVGSHESNLGYGGPGTPLQYMQWVEGGYNLTGALPGRLQCCLFAAHRVGFLAARTLWYPRWAQNRGAAMRLPTQSMMDCAACPRLHSQSNTCPTTQPPLDLSTQSCHALPPDSQPNTNKPTPPRVHTPPHPTTLCRTLALCPPPPPAPRYRPGHGSGLLHRRARQAALQGPPLHPGAPCEQRERAALRGGPHHPGLGADGGTQVSL